jgi:hypothetical protein
MEVMKACLSTLEALGEDATAKEQLEGVCSKLSTLQAPTGATPYDYSLQKFWPDQTLKDILNKSGESPMTGIVRELDHMVVMQFIRDLVTEPSIHAQIPTSRDVTLRCAPPPEQSAILTAASVAASVEKAGAGGKFDFRIAETVAKLFEQTERTVFLQYALFRLCEMSVNSASEFRNVFPLITHEIVRQAGSLSTEAAIEGERAKKAAAEAQGAQAKGLAGVAKAETERLQCVKTEQGREQKAISADELVKKCGPVPKVSVTDLMKPEAPESISEAEPDGGKSSGSEAAGWAVRTKTNTTWEGEVIAQGAKARRVRICVTDLETASARVRAGEVGKDGDSFPIAKASCHDVEGQVVRLELDGPGSAKGTYQYVE